MLCSVWRPLFVHNLPFLRYIHCNFCLNLHITLGDMKENVSGSFFLNTVYSIYHWHWTSFEYAQRLKDSKKKVVYYWISKLQLNILVKFMNFTVDFVEQLIELIFCFRPNQDIDIVSMQKDFTSSLLQWFIQGAWMLPLLWLTRNLCYSKDDRAMRAI